MQCLFLAPLIEIVLAGEYVFLFIEFNFYPNFLEIFVLIIISISSPPLLSSCAPNTFFKIYYRILYTTVEAHSVSLDLVRNVWYFFCCTHRSTSDRNQISTSNNSIFCLFLSLLPFAYARWTRIASPCHTLLTLPS